jgi:hypothetical protein
LGREYRVENNTELRRKRELKGRVEERERERSSLHETTPEDLP